MERKISDLYNMLPFGLTTGQKNFLAVATSGSNVLCQGSAGSGKSAVLQILKEFWGDKVIFTAMTGIANMRLFDNKGGAGTTARVMGLPIGIASPKDWKEVTRYCNEVMLGSDKVEYVVIEECGSLNSEQLHLLEHRIKRMNKKTKKRRRRDIKLILCGDLLQLGTITSDKEKAYFSEHYGSHLFFKSVAFARMNFQTVYLDEVKRQKDKTFMAALDVMRYGNTDRIPRLLTWLNQRYTPNTPTDVPRLCATKKAVDSFNIAALAKNPNEAFVYTAEIQGSFDMKNSCPAEEEVEVKVGMICMTLINSECGSYQNGCIGTITGVSASGVWVRFKHSDEEVLVEPHEFVEKEQVEVGRKLREDGTDEVTYELQEIGKCSQIPIVHAAAITVHKSQGATIESEFVIDMGSTWAYDNFEDFGCALSYVAWSRATDFHNIHLTTKIKPSHIKVCEETIMWLYSVDAIDYTKLSKKLLDKCVRYKQGV